MEKSKNRIVYKKKTSSPSIKFNSIYARLFYQWLKEQQHKEEISISLKDLSNILKVPQNGHTYCTLRPSVLSVIKQEFNLVESSLNFSYEIEHGHTVKIKILHNHEIPLD